MEQDDRVNKTTLIAAVIGTVIATVAALEFAGVIQHTTDKDIFPLADYKVVLLSSGEQHRLSSKPAQQFAYCRSGFLFIQSETDTQLHGPLVDFRNRGIPCAAADFINPGGLANLDDACLLPWFIRPKRCR